MAALKLKDARLCVIPNQHGDIALQVCIDGRFYPMSLFSLQLQVKELEIEDKERTIARQTSAVKEKEREITRLEARVSFVNTMPRNVI